MRNLTPPQHLLCTACPAVYELPDGRLLVVGEIATTGTLEEVGAVVRHGEQALVIDRMASNHLARSLGLMVDELVTAALREAYNPIIETLKAENAALRREVALTRPEAKEGCPVLPKAASPL